MSVGKRPLGALLVWSRPWAPEAERLGDTLVSLGLRPRYAADVEQARAAVRQRAPGVVMIDARCPDASVLALVRWLRRQRAAENACIVMVGYPVGVEAADRTAHSVAALAAGCDDCIDIACPPRELGARLRAILRARREDFDEPCLEYKGLRVLPVQQRVIVEGEEVRVHARDIALLLQLMSRRGRPVSRSTLLDSAWEDWSGSCERTVDVHIYRLRQALKPSGYDRLIETLPGEGYRFSMAERPRRAG